VGGNNRPPSPNHLTPALLDTIKLASARADERDAALSELAGFREALHVAVAQLAEKDAVIARLRGQLRAVISGPTVSEEWDEVTAEPDGDSQAVVIDGGVIPSDTSSERNRSPVHADQHQAGGGGANGG
jgi:hypothetical protein